MRRTFTYVAGGFALLLVMASIGSAVFYAATNGAETLKNLATSTLQGVGVAIGGVLGSALILHFRAGRSFIKDLIKDLK